MIAGMWLGVRRGLGSVPMPWAWLTNLLLLAQFPLAHSLLLSGRGRKVLVHFAPADSGQTLATTTFAILASIQLFALFALWTPSGVVWWHAEGPVLWGIAALYAGSWLLLIKASWDAGAEVQSGLLGWVSLLRGVKPQFPPMPHKGLFRLIRQPIYVSFALTTWTVPTWTPDHPERSAPGRGLGPAAPRPKAPASRSPQLRPARRHRRRDRRSQPGGGRQPHAAASAICRAAAAGGPRGRGMIGRSGETD